jgi:hypothetical protein
MPRLFAPLRPKRHDSALLPEPLRTPGSAGHPSDITAPGNVKPEPGTVPPVPPNELPMQQPAPMDNMVHEEPSPQSQDGTMWPSEIYAQSSTMWLLPPYTDQSSAIAMLLQTEIQAHKITREMLHATEQRRLEAVQNINQLQVDIRSWTTAHENLTFVFGKCSEELSRLRAENEKMSLQLQHSTV